MQHWYLVVFFLGVGAAPAWGFYRATQTGRAKVPAGFAKYGISGIEIATRTESPGLYNRIKALQLAVAIVCFLLAGLVGWAS
jgi:hypothetical protein